MKTPEFKFKLGEIVRLSEDSVFKTATITKRTYNDEITEMNGRPPAKICYELNFENRWLTENEIYHLPGNMVLPE